MSLDPLWKLLEVSEGVTSSLCHLGHRGTNQALASHFYDLFSALEQVGWRKDGV